jgi:hypothetical protein
LERDWGVRWRSSARRWWVLALRSEPEPREGRKATVGSPPVDERIGLDGKVRRLLVRTDRQDALALSNLMNKLIVDIELF